MASRELVAPDDVPPSSHRGLRHIDLMLRRWPRGMVILASGGEPEDLGDLLRVLVASHPSVDIRTDLRDAGDAPDGSPIVLALDGSDEDGIDVEWALHIKSSGPRVVIWCKNHNTGLVLAQRLHGVAGWVFVRRRLRDHPRRHARLGLRCALVSRAPGVAWAPPDRTAAEPPLYILGDAVHAALRGRKTKFINARDNLGELVAAVRSAGPDWIGASAYQYAEARRLEWVLAKSGRRGRVIVSTPAARRTQWFPGFHPVHDEIMDLRAARDRLARAGAARPGLLAGLTGLESEAVELAGRLVESGVHEQEILAAACATSDPGASLARLAHEQGFFTLDDVARTAVHPPAMRAFGASNAVRALRDRSTVYAVPGNEDNGRV